jgi:hypothetical protein
MFGESSDERRKILGCPLDYPKGKGGGHPNMSEYFPAEAEYVCDLNWRSGMLVILARSIVAKMCSSVVDVIAQMHITYWKGTFRFK